MQRFDVGGDLSPAANHGNRRRQRNAGSANTAVARVLEAPASGRAVRAKRSEALAAGGASGLTVLRWRERLLSTRCCPWLPRIGRPKPDVQ